MFDPKESPESGYPDCVIAYDGQRHVMVFRVIWEEEEWGEESSEVRGHGPQQVRASSFTIPIETLAQSGRGMRVADSIAELCRLEDVPDYVGDALWSAWIDVRKSVGAYDRTDDALESRKPLQQVEHEVVRFLETATPVLARFEAEVEMCEDEMQRSRLQAILDSLRRFSPEVPEGEVADSFVPARPDQSAQPVSKSPIEPRGTLSTVTPAPGSIFFTPGHMEMLNRAKSGLSYSAGGVTTVENRLTITRFEQESDEF